MRHVFLFGVLLFGATSVVGQVRELRPDDHPESIYTASSRVLEASGVPAVSYGTDYRAAPGSPEEMAREFLRVRGPNMGIDEAALRHVASRETPGGSRARFVQMVSGYPVFESDVVITLAPDGRVAFVVNGFTPGLQLRDSASKTGGASAVAAAREYLGVFGTPNFERSALVVYQQRGVARLVHKVELSVRREVAGDWQLLVDAASGEVIRAVNLATGHKGETHSAARPGRLESPASAPAANSPASAPTGNSPAVHVNRVAMTRVDATGWVFDPDPLSTAGATYGVGVEDADDADSQILTDQLVQVTLPDVSFDGTTYLLEGPYIRITDVEAPNDGVFGHDTPEFHFTRADSSFEAVNAYYHVDKSLRYVNETLGFPLKPYQYDEGLLVDPHGWSGEDNSSYSSFAGLLSFGEGGVDDAEDSDVILHELGHGMHDWLTNGGLSQVDGLSEGSGDYWTNSYNRSLGLWGTAEERAWVFHWDGHNEFWDGRTTAYDAHYPDELSGSIHTDGQIWASSLMEIWEQLGRETTDLLFLEALSMTGPSTSQSDAAFAFMQADTLLNAGANSDVIRDVFLRRGYLLRANFDASKRAGVPPLLVDFSDASFAAGAGIETWAWDLDGDGTTDATGQTPSYTYEDPGLYTVSLTVTANGAETSITLLDYVSVNEGVYLWQGGDDQFDRSGTYIRNHLLLRKLPNAYSKSASIHSPLTGYDAVFVSLGSYATGATPLEGGNVEALRAYIQGGGSVFLDGSEALGFDQAEDDAFLALFGISESEDGTSDDVPVQNLTGHPLALTAGMTFTGTTQIGLNYIDRFTPEPPALAAFVETGYGTVGVQNELPGGGKTFAMSYALGLLDDGDHPSTRTALLDRILQFFEVGLFVGTDSEDLPEAFGLDPIYPNPFSSAATVRFRLSTASEVTLSVYNTLGQRVIERAEFLTAGEHTRTLEGDALPSGTYFVRLSAGERVSRQTVTVVR